MVRKLRNRVRLAALVVAAVLAPLAASSEETSKPLKGVALVIGQSQYEHIAPLSNPANDARDMVKLLTNMGFDARSVSDRDAKKLSRDLERFVEDAEGADVAFLYYSGHGIESGGENWLVPVDADAGSLEAADGGLAPLSGVLDELKATVPVAIVLLDACRTNPFPPGALVKRTPDEAGAPIGAGGLTPVRSVKALGTDAKAADNLGTVIGFAAEPGHPALDGVAGENSPYAAALIRHLGAMEGNEFGSVMRMVTEEVYLDTKTRQRPWVNESLRRLLYFGVPAEAPSGDEALITGERRKLLLTISDLADASRLQVETVALQDDVPLDALYGVLRALGTDKIPRDAGEMEKVLDAQAERLRKMFASRDALRSDDPEIQRLVASADRAIGEGAIETARLFLDDAVGRVEATEGAVDEAEALIKQKRIADAALYARRAEASSLAFDYAAAAADYAKAFGLIERWDDKLRWNYKNLEAEALNAQGSATGETAALEKAVKAYETVLDFIPRGEQNRDWAITRNNMAVVLQTLGERKTDTAELEAAAEIFRESLAVFEREKDDINWAAAQNNIGNVLLKLGQREKDAARLEQAVAAFRATLEKRPREKLPMDWASSQNNIGIALYTLGERQGDTARMDEAEAAYRLALEVYTRESAPVEWAMVKNNLGNTLTTLANYRNQPEKAREAARTFREAMEVRTREHFPLDWAMSRLNLGNALSTLTRFDLGTEVLDEAAAAYNDALGVFDRDRFPLDWASVQNNLGAIYQTLGQRTANAARIEESVAAFETARQVYTREALPLDWAMTHFNAGNSLSLLGGLTRDPARHREAAASYREALKEYDRDSEPRQWALAQAGIGSALQWLSNDEPGSVSLRQSIAARRAALEVFSLENAPVDWANTQNGLGMALINLGNREQTDRYLSEAGKAIEASLKVFTREKQPLQWAFGQNNLGDVHWNLATFGGGRPDFERAIALFESAKQGFTEAGYSAPIPLTDQKIAIVKDMIDKR